MDRLTLFRGPSRLSVARAALAAAALVAAAAPLAADQAPRGPAPLYAASVVYAAAPAREGPDHWLRLYSFEGAAGLRCRDYELAGLGVRDNELGFQGRESHRYDFRVYGKALYILDFDRSGSPTLPRGFWVNEGDKVLVFEIGPDLGLAKRAELLLMGPGRKTRTDEQFYQDLAFLDEGVWFTQVSVMSTGVEVLKGWALGDDPLAPAARVLKDLPAREGRGEFRSERAVEATRFQALLYATGGDYDAALAVSRSLGFRLLGQDQPWPYGRMIKAGDRLLDTRSGKSSKLPKDQAGSEVYSYNDRWARPGRAYLRAGERDWLVELRGDRLQAYDLKDPAAPKAGASLRLGYALERSVLFPLPEGLALASSEGRVTRLRLGADGSMAAAWGPETLLAAMLGGDPAAVASLALAQVDPRSSLPEGRSIFAAALAGKASPACLEAYLDACLEAFGPGESYGGFDSRSCLRAALKAGNGQAAAALLARFPGALDDAEIASAVESGDAALIRGLVGLAPGALARGSADAFGRVGILFRAKDEATRKLLVSLGAAERTRLEKPFPVYCADQDVRIRAAPSVDAAVLGKASYGEEYLLLGRSNLRFESGGKVSSWIEIRSASGLEGWSFGGFYSPSRPPR